MDTTSTSRPRTVIRFLALWVFGLATTLLLGGLWGRQVAGDRAALEASVRAGMVADVVGDRIGGWLADGIAVAADLPVPEVADAVDAVTASPETERAMAALTDQVVAALLAPPGSAPVIDLASALEPTVPVLAAELAERGIPADEATIRAALGALDPIVLGAGDLVGLAGVAREARTFLTWVVVVAFAIQVAAGGAVLGVSTDRRDAARTLAVRLGMSAVSYAVLFRVGSWALDPQRGRAPVVAGGSVLLGSDLWVFAAVGGIACAAALIAARTSGRSDEGAGAHEDTEELVAV